MGGCGRRALWRWRVRVDMCGVGAHVLHMPKMIQVRNVPDDLHRTLKIRAALAGMSLSEYLLRELRHAAARPTPEEMRSRLEKRSRVEPEEPVAEAVRRERDAR